MSLQSWIQLSQEATAWAAAHYVPGTDLFVQGGEALRRERVAALQATGGPPTPGETRRTQLWKAICAESSAQRDLTQALGLSLPEGEAALLWQLALEWQYLGRLRRLCGHPTQEAPWWLLGDWKEAQRALATREAEGWRWHERLGLVLRGPVPERLALRWQARGRIEEDRRQQAADWIGARRVVSAAQLARQGWTPRDLQPWSETHWAELGDLLWGLGLPQAWLEREDPLMPDPLSLPGRLGRSSWQGGAHAAKQDLDSDWTCGEGGWTPADQRELPPHLGPQGAQTDFALLLLRGAAEPPLRRPAPGLRQWLGLEATVRPLQAAGAR